MNTAIRRSLALAIVLLASAMQPALAIVGHGPQWSATYVVAYQPTFGTRGVPFSGTMKLNFNHEIISGTYVSQSVRPDPLFGRTVLVSGGVQHGHITLNFLSSANFTVRGTLAGDGEISGTATIRGQFFNFLARVKSSP